MDINGVDITAISVFGFALVKVVMWVVVGLLAVAILRSVRRQMQTTSTDDGTQVPKVGDVLWSHKGRISIWVILFAAVMIYSQAEMGYRPKTVVQPSNPELTEQLRNLDQAETPVIGPAEGDLRDAENTGYSERNARENEAAREQFQQLPE